MQLLVEQGNLTQRDDDAIIVNLFEGVTSPAGATGAVDKALGGLIRHVIQQGDMRGQLNEALVLYPQGKIPAKRVILVGLGPVDSFNHEAIRTASANALLKAREVGARRVASIVHGAGLGGLPMRSTAQATVEGALLALYRYQSPLSQNTAPAQPDVERLTLVEFDVNRVETIQAGAETGKIIADAVLLTRDLVNTPANLLTPSLMARKASEMASGTEAITAILSGENLTPTPELIADIQRIIKEIFINQGLSHPQTLKAKAQTSLLENFKTVCRRVLSSHNISQQSRQALTDKILAHLLSQGARSLMRQLECRVLEEDDMATLGMGALLGVTRGSSEPARFIILTHKGADTAPIVLVGKGVTFDTGGYTLKSGSNMVGMKNDMGGAAAVMGIMQAVARLNLPLHVMGLIPTAENMISGTAYKPNDVLQAMNGKTIEVISTDAEGRLLLADALCYADSLNPQAVIDMATLTGGVGVALGRHYSGLFCHDDALRQAIQQAGESVNEKVWHLPHGEAYNSQLQSDVADLKNTGGRLGSASSATQFLSHFTGDWPWAHLDIAATVKYTNGPTDSPRAYLSKGATGIPVRSILQALQNWGS